MYFNNPAQQNYDQRPPQRKFNKSGFKRYGQPGNCYSSPPAAKRPNNGPQAPPPTATSDWSPHREQPNRPSHPLTAAPSEQVFRSPVLRGPRGRTQPSREESPQTAVDSGRPEPSKATCRNFLLLMYATSECAPQAVSGAGTNRPSTSLPHIEASTPPPPTDPTTSNEQKQPQFSASPKIIPRIDFHKVIDESLQRYEEAFTKERAAREAEFEKERDAWRSERQKLHEDVERQTKTFEHQQEVLLHEQKAQLTQEWDEEKKRLEASREEELQVWKDKYDKERKRVERLMRAKDDLAAKHSNVVDRLKMQHEEALQKLSADHYIEKLGWQQQMTDEKQKNEQSVDEITRKYVERIEKMQKQHAEEKKALTDAGEKWQKKLKREHDKRIKAEQELETLKSEMASKLDAKEQEMSEHLRQTFEAEWKSKIVELESRLQALRDNEERLTTENSFFQTKSTSLEATNATLQATIDGFMNQEGDLQKDLSERQTRIEELSQQVDTRDKAIVGFANRIAALEKERVELEKEARDKLLQFVREMDATFNKNKLPSRSE
ncbi:hypothetical protein AAVH_22144 [Aphelenchoides avenae]|nr:hypothetical protein AAVH_22144 [Aphelenchus avenae]